MATTHKFSPRTKHIVEYHHFRLFVNGKRYRSEDSNQLCAYGGAASRHLYKTCQDRSVSKVALSSNGLVMYLRIESGCNVTRECDNILLSMNRLRHLLIYYGIGTQRSSGTRHSNPRIQVDGIDMTLNGHGIRWTWDR